MLNCLKGRTVGRNQAYKNDTCHIDNKDIDNKKQTIEKLALLICHSQSFPWSIDGHFSVRF